MNKFRLPIYYDEGETVSAVAEPAATAPAQHTTDSTATADAATREPSVGSEDRYKGWIPPDAHERVVDGFHKRLDAVSWASGLSREDVEDALALRRAAAARSKESDEPKPDARDEQGRLYYSDEQARRLSKWEAGQLVNERLSEFEQRYGPIAETLEMTQRRETAALSQIEEARTWKDFEKHLDAINGIMKDARTKGERISLYEAYAQAREDAVIAAQGPELKKKWLAELNQTNTVAKDDVNPNRVASASRKDIRDMDTIDAVREVRKELAAKRKAS